MVIGSTNSTINATNFSIQLDTLQFGIWTLFVVAVLQLMLSTKRALLYHEQENLVVSMARERQRFQNSYSWSCCYANQRFRHQRRFYTPPVFDNLNVKMFICKYWKPNKN